MNGKKARALKAQRKAEEARFVEAVRAAHPRMLGTDGEMEVWEKGPTKMWVPVVRDHYSPELKVGLTLRRAAIFDLECPCGAEVRVTPSRQQIALRHAPTCVASGEQLQPLADAAGVDTERRDG